MCIPDFYVTCPVSHLYVTELGYPLALPTHLSPKVLTFPLLCITSAHEVPLSVKTNQIKNTFQLMQYQKDGFLSLTFHSLKS